MRHAFYRFAALALLMFLGSAEANARRELCVHGLSSPDQLSVRAGPGPRHEVIASMPARACGVRLVGRCRGQWCEMALGQRAGWVQTRFIGVYEIPERPAAQTRLRRAAAAVIEQGSGEPRLCVARVDRDDTLRLRGGPGVDYSAISRIPPQACGVARAGRCHGPWCRVAWRGQVGWVNTYYLD